MKATTTTFATIVTIEFETIFQLYIDMYADIAADDPSLNIWESQIDNLQLMSTIRYGLPCIHNNSYDDYKSITRKFRELFCDELFALCFGYDKLSEPTMVRIKFPGKYSNPHVGFVDIAHSEIEF